MMVSVKDAWRPLKLRSLVKSCLLSQRTRICPVPETTRLGWAPTSGTKAKSEPNPSRAATSKHYSDRKVVWCQRPAGLACSGATTKLYKMIDYYLCAKPQTFISALCQNTQLSASSRCIPSCNGGTNLVIEAKDATP